MFKIQLREKTQAPDMLLVFVFMIYISLVIASIVLFKEIIQINLGSLKLNISGSTVAYIFNYPICFFVLRLYGYKTVNRMIASMLITAFIFVAFCKIIIALPHDPQVARSYELANILASTFKTYLAGFIAVPAGIYASFIALSMLDKIGARFSILSLSLSTVFGEIINTFIIFPIGFHDTYTMTTIINTFIIDALIFKTIAGVILATLTILAVNFVVKYKLDRT